MKKFPISTTRADGKGIAGVELMSKGISLNFVCLMKLSILVLGLFLTALSLQAQDSLNQTDKAGLKQGLWRKHYPNGNIRYEGNFSNDQPEGEFRYYHESGGDQDDFRVQQQRPVFPNQRL